MGSLFELAQRRESLAQVTDVVRSARAVGDDTGFVMHELRSGRSTVHWDIDSPRPVSATLTADRTGLPTLVAFYDARQFGGPRPEVPGPAFSSGVLWAFAQEWVDVMDARCVSVPVTTDVTETVKCPLPDGGMLTFGLAANRAHLTDLRVEISHDGGKVPGSVDVRPWSRYDGPEVGQLVQFIIADDLSPAVYFDDDATLAYGFFFGPPGSSPDELLERWSGGARIP